jgi:hypothetical protein
MKRLWIVMVIIAGILTSGYLSLWHIDREIKQMDAGLTEIKKSVENKKIDQAFQLADALSAEWEKSLKVMMHYVYKDDLEAITNMVSHLRALIKYENDGYADDSSGHDGFEELVAEMESLRKMLNHLKEDQTPTFRTVF